MTATRSPVRSVRVLTLMTVAALLSACQRGGGGGTNSGTAPPPVVSATATTNQLDVSDGFTDGLQQELDAAQKLNADTAEHVKAIRPVLKCVESVSATEWRAHFGYANASHEAIAIAVSVFNRLWPPPLGRGQPTRFVPGTADDVVQVAFNPRGSTAWVLGSRFVMANAHSTLCRPRRTAGQ